MSNMLADTWEWITGGSGDSSPDGADDFVSYGDAGSIAMTEEAVNAFEAMHGPIQPYEPSLVKPGWSLSVLFRGIAADGAVAYIDGNLAAEMGFADKAVVDTWESTKTQADVNAFTTARNLQRNALAESNRKYAEKNSFIDNLSDGVSDLFRKLPDIPAGVKVSAGAGLLILGAFAVWRLT